MTKAEFLKSLDFESAKTTIARKMSIKPETITVKVSKTGVFEIDLKNANSATGILVSGAKKAVLAVTKVDIGEATDAEGKPNGVFAYNAEISIIIKNADIEYSAKIGELDFVKNKLIFSTNAEIAAQEKAAKEKQKAEREAAKKAKAEAKKQAASAKKEASKKEDAPSKKAEKAPVEKKAPAKKAEKKVEAPKAEDPKKEAAPKKVSAKKAPVKKEAKAETNTVEVKPIAAETKVIPKKD